MTPLRITAENIAWEWTSAEPDYERDWLSLADAIEKALSDLAPAITRQQHFVAVDSTAVLEACRAAARNRRP